MFTICETGFAGLKIIKTTDFHDDRGCFRKLFSADEYVSSGLESDFRELYYSVNKKDVIRGMHFQTPPSDHVKVVYVVSGSIIDVILDLRKKSSTYGTYFTVKLTGDDPSFVYIPKGFAHGFKSLEDGSVVHYAQTSCYDKNHDCGIRYDSFGYDWKIERPIISERDKAHPAFSNYSSPF